MRRGLDGARAATAWIVFVAGAGVMSLEIVGSRVLAPYFGNSIFVWGSLIVVFLFAMAAGYLVGGRLSLRSPRPAWICLQLVLAGTFLILLPSWFAPVCRAIVTSPEGMGRLGPRSGPLVASAALFAPPILLASMVVPFAVRLAARDIRSVGSVAGRLYSLGTLGSIVGTLVTAFWLVPDLGTRCMLTGIGAVLGASGFLALLVDLPRRRGGTRHAERVVAAAVLAVGVAMRLALGTPPTLPFEGESGPVVLDELDTPYQHILVTRTTEFYRDGSPMRRVNLWFGRHVQGGVYEHPTLPRGKEHWSALAYTDLLHLYRLFAPVPRRLLMLGGGAGVAPVAFRRHDPGLEIDVVEVDEKVLQVARRYLHCRPDPGIHQHVADGRVFLERHQQRRWDVIVVDVFTGEGQPPFHMMTREFLELARNRLERGGVLLVVMDSALAGRAGRIFRSEYRTLRSVFRQVYVFPGVAADGSDDPTEPSRNFWQERRDAVLIATMESEPTSRRELRRRAARLWGAAKFEGASYWNEELYYLCDLAARVIEPEDLEAGFDGRRDLRAPVDFSDALELTDDHAPVYALKCSVARQ